MATQKRTTTSRKRSVTTGREAEPSVSGPVRAPTAAESQTGAQSNTDGTAPSVPTKLELVVSWGNIAARRDVELLVVGRYRNTPLTGAVGTLDKELLSNYLTDAVAMGMLNSQLGDLFCQQVPRTRTGGKPTAVMIAGMGESGNFGWNDLIYLMTNVGFAALESGVHHVATVLIGTGGNVLTPERSLRATIDGFRDSLDRFAKRPSPTSKRLSMKVEVVEYSIETCLQLYDRLAKMEKENSELDGLKAEFKLDANLTSFEEAIIGKLGPYVPNLASNSMSDFRSAILSPEAAHLISPITKVAGLAPEETKSFLEKLYDLEKNDPDSRLERLNFLGRLWRQIEEFELIFRKRPTRGRP